MRMRNLWIATALAVGIVVAATVLIDNWLDDIQKRKDDLERAYAECADTLLELNRRYRYQPRASLDERRMPAYLEVRAETARVFRAKMKESSEDHYFHARETRNFVLGVLTGWLDTKRMSLDEYLAISARWQSLLARGYPFSLLGAWRRRVATKEFPEGLPLPEPAAAQDVTPEEDALFRKVAPDLEDSLEVDLLVPTLRSIAAGESQPVEPAGRKKND